LINDLFSAPPAPTFEEPLEMLLACHGRIQSQCATLKKLLAHLPEHGCDAQAQQAAQAILRYFDTAGIHHHNDEEKNLFPALLASSAAEAPALIARILDEHKIMDAAWQQLRPYLNSIASGQSGALNAATAEHFIDVYDRHIALENSQLLPLAKQILSAGQLQEIGKCMAARRMN
jgi:hemerythrin-like domain-containing protein